MKLALFGLKGHENVVLSGARELGQIEVVGIAHDRPEDIAKLKESQPWLSSAAEYPHWRQLLEHSMPDIVCVCDENWMRAEQLIALAERGIHIVTEKPLTTTHADLNRVRYALANSRSKLTMLLTMRHEAKYATFREIVQRGDLGTICQVTAQKSYRMGQRPEWQKSRQTLGGIIPFIGIHPIDLIRWTTGLEYTRVAALHSNLGRPEFRETEDSASLLLELSNGGSATIRLDYLRPETAPTHGDDRIRIAGSKGVLEVQGADAELLLTPVGQEPRRVPLQSVDNLFVAFVKALRSGGEVPISTADCIKVTEYVLHARDAADCKNWIIFG